MSLAEKAAKAKPKKHNNGQLCDVVKASRVLSPEDAKALWSLVLERLDLDARHVSDLLAEEEIYLSDYTIRRHRGGRCVFCRREGRYGSR